MKPKVRLISDLSLKLLLAIYQSLTPEAPCEALTTSSYFLYMNRFGKIMFTNLDQYKVARIVKSKFAVVFHSYA